MKKNSLLLVIFALSLVSCKGLMNALGETQESFSCAIKLGEYDTCLDMKADKANEKLCPKGYKAFEKRSCKATEYNLECSTDLSGGKDKGKYSAEKIFAKSDDLGDLMELNKESRETGDKEKIKKADEREKKKCKKIEDLAEKAFKKS